METCLIFPNLTSFKKILCQALAKKTTSKMQTQKKKVGLVNAFTIIYYSVSKSIY